MDDLTPYHYVSAVFPCLKCLIKSYWFSTLFFCWNEEENCVKIRAQFFLNVAKVANVLHLAYILSSAAYILKTQLAFADKLLAMDILICLTSTLVLRWDWEEDILPFQMICEILQNGRPRRLGTWIHYQTYIDFSVIV